MNEDARAKLVKDIEAKQKVLQRQAEDAQNEFQQEQNTIAQRILQKLGPVIDKYAKDNGFGLLIDSSNPWPQGPVLWANQAVDISKTIVDQYNTVSGVPAQPKPASGARTRRKPAGVTPTRQATGEAWPSVISKRLREYERPPQGGLFCLTGYPALSLESFGERAKERRSMRPVSPQQLGDFIAKFDPEVAKVIRACRVG